MPRVRRPTNRELVTEMRRLLTEGAKEALLGDEEAMALTKPWRSAMWRHFAVIAGRMLPCDEEGGPAPPMELDDEDSQGRDDDA